MKAGGGVGLLINNCTKKLICGLRNKRVSKTESKNFASSISLRHLETIPLIFFILIVKMRNYYTFENIHIEASTHMHTSILFPTPRGYCC